MSHTFDYETAERSSLIERCRAFETLHRAEHALCMSAFKERDTCRDLCEELIEAINKKSIAENLNQHIEAMAGLECVIAKAQSILGGSNAT